jgi:hypothetical protein
LDRQADDFHGEQEMSSLWRLGHDPSEKGKPMSDKATQPPKRIYLQWYGSSSPDDSGEIDEHDVTWSPDRLFKHDIVYVRLPRKRRKYENQSAIENR